jgi:hypothetical protein
MIAYAMTRKRGRVPASGGSVATPVWLLFGATALTVLLTYAWRPTAELYHVSVGGFAGGLGRTLVYLNYPIALAAIAIVLVLWPLLDGRERGIGAVACALCAVTVVAVDQDDLDARWINVLPAIGTALALALSLRHPLRAEERLRGDPLRVGLAAALAVLSVPWLFATVGFYAPDPIFADELNRGAHLPADEDTRAAVHVGSHHGLSGVLLALAALVLSRARPITAVASGAVALMLCYGVAIAAQDAWLEQVEKRGWVEHGLPSMTVPSLSFGWLGIVVAATLVELLWFRRERRASG